ncbi:MAG: hypothetical protein Kow0068_26400 [Marinilabiliales bacterium]|uniref:ABC-three component system middle component 6 n=1 Tax=Rarispira pelagica TaxID=3141764 RepID=UPI003B28B5DE
MILGKDINPKKQIYYISALVLNELKSYDNTEFDFFDVFNSLKRKEKDITINLYSLSLDWLYLLGAIKKDKNRLIKCF